MDQSNNITNNDIPYNASSIASAFQIPITYDPTHRSLSDIVQDDIGATQELTPYHSLCDPSSVLDTLLFSEYGKYYTTNTDFLSDYSRFIRKYNGTTKNAHKEHMISSEMEELLQSFIGYKNNKGFKEAFEYVAWSHLDWMNRSSSILQVMTYYNLGSPIIHLTLPIVFLIIPFILIKWFMKVPITLSLYKTLLAKQFSQHSIGKFFSLFSNDLTTEKKMSVSLSVAFYLFTMYQNVLSCIKFYNKSFEISSYLWMMKKFVNHSLHTHNAVIENASHCKTEPMANFRKNIERNREQLISLCSELEFCRKDPKPREKFFSYGSYLRNFYRLQQDEDMQQCLYYAFSLEAFHNNTSNLNHLYREKWLTPCKFTTKRDAVHIKKQYYAYHCKASPVKNNTSLCKNAIITGPNASGKTTLLKSTLTNLVLSQQWGVGCYASARITPYDTFFSYLNIPDTSERDSLFQAEARRCVDLIHLLERSPKERIFVIFDELYSGTNPYEATRAAKAFLQYVENNTNVRYLLTTHFTELTEMPSVSLLRMKCIQEEKKIEYTYSSEEGVNQIQGGFQVLRDLCYPKEILDTIDNLDSDHREKD